MARFILDVLNADVDRILDIVEQQPLSDYVARITVIDRTNDNQLHADELKNCLSQGQIDNYNTELALLSKHRRDL